MLPLDGITVVSIEQAVAAPFATRQLADLGARVIKIERPDGGDFARGYDTTVKGLSSYFVWLNRSKQSITIDLKKPEGQRILASLLERADVLVQNLAPGAAERLGTAPASLRERHPRLIICNVTGYGSTGPYAPKKAYDLLVQSEVGLVSITGTEESPSKVGISVADIAAGMYAYSGVLTALLARANTGRGTVLDISLFDALAEWMGSPALHTAYGGSAPPRTGANHATIAPYGPFRVADGSYIYLGIQNAREWIRFCSDVLDQPALADDDRFRTNPLRVQHRLELQAIVEASFQGLSFREVAERLDRAQIAHARMNSITEFLAHPQLEARGRWRDIDSPAGPLRALLPPVCMDEVDPVMAAVPSLGQHTQSILEEIGIDRATIGAWRQAGIV